MSFKQSESTHFYHQDATPCYELPYADPKKGMRSTTLRDAKKLNLYPSVTTILSILDKPGLNAWKLNQVLLSALTLPKLENESLDAFSKRVVVDSQEHGRKAREEGTRIHGVVEAFYACTGQTHTEVDFEIVCEVDKALTEHFGDQKWLPEKSFAHAKGYGGKVDLHTKEVVVDLKTKEFGPDDKVIGYDEQCMQLAAYAYGLGYRGARCANVFISVNNPGLVVVYEWTPEQILRGLNMFFATLSLWQEMKNYTPKGI